MNIFSDNEDNGKKKKFITFLSSNNIRWQTDRQISITGVARSLGSMDKVQ